jgi:cytosine/adenosine deaminase-related metal-dependent hydrolase
MDDADTRYPDEAVAIDNGLLVDVGAGKELVAHYVAEQVVHVDGAPVHPHPIECRLHASFHTSGGAMSDDFLEDHDFPVFERHFYNEATNQDEHLSVVLAAIEMIRNGTACFMETGTILNPAAAATAAEQIGIRAILGDTFMWDSPLGFAHRNEGTTASSTDARDRNRPTTQPTADDPR